MHRRATTLLVLLAAGSLLATACSDDGTAAPTTGGGAPAATVPPAGRSIQGDADSPAPRPAGDPERSLKVAIVTADDATAVFARAGLEGVRAAATEDGHVELAEITGPTAAEVATVAQKLCDDRYDLVIGHGAGLTEPLTTIAAGCPTTSFLTTDGTAAAHPPTVNVDDWSVSAVDVGYPLGFLAGTAVAPGARVAIVTGPAGVDATPIVDAFRQGLAAENPAATTSVLGDATAADVAGLGAALVFCASDAGCDEVAQTSGLAVLRAWGQPTDAPAALAATSLDLTALYRDAFHLVRQQRWGGVTFTSTVENGQVGVVVDGAATAGPLAVSGGELARAADDLTAQLRSGARKLPDATA